ncbi:MAG: isochorismatase family protein [Bacteroidota bacterium]
MEKRLAILLIDIQNDFCHDGVLPAKNTFSLIQPLNRLIFWALKRNYLCIYIRDWHPSNHCSFNTFGGTWPPHCIQGTHGANFTDGILVPDSSYIIDIEKKPDQSNFTYSAFENSSLKEDLHRLKINHLAVAGIATEYCVKATVLEGLKFGFSFTVFSDLVRPINMMPDDDLKALDEMKEAGAEIQISDEWIRSIELFSIS